MRLNYFAVAVVAVIAFGSCERAPIKTIEESAKSVPPPKEEAQISPPASLPQSLPAALPAPTTPGTVSSVIIAAEKSPAEFKVEIAETDAERAHGLMQRESLPADQGMWFVFPRTVEPLEGRFWMKDTKIPLDIIFVDETMKVVCVIENTVPESTELLSSSASFRYVLEVTAGTAEKFGIKAGDEVKRAIGSQ